MIPSEREREMSHLATSKPVITHLFWTPRNTLQIGHKILKLSAKCTPRYPFLWTITFNPVSYPASSSFLFVYYADADSFREIVSQIPAVEISSS
jgi:hypothetical protein